MGINIRQKGFTAEREIATDLNAIIHLVYDELGIQRPEKPPVQRNQLQSAVGGCDLTGTFGFAVEVKRQEALSIGSWWTQCVKSAENLGEIPVLLFRQSKQKWRCIMFSRVYLPGDGNLYVKVRSEISYEDFKTIFRVAVRKDLAANKDTLLYPTLF